MPKEEGLVIKVLPEGALVLIKKADACHGCPSSKLCHMGGTGERQVLARNPVDAQKGQRVEIEVRDGLLIKASFIIYMLPVLGLLVGGLVGRWIVAALGMPVSLDTGAVIGGLTCMIAVFILIKLKSGSSSHMKVYQPTIIKIKQEEVS